MRIQNDRQVSFKGLKGLHETHNICGERLLSLPLCLGWGARGAGWGLGCCRKLGWEWRYLIYEGSKLMMKGSFTWVNSYCGETGTELKWKNTKKREEIGPVDRGRVTGRCPQQANWHFFQYYSKPQERRPGEISRLILTWTQLSSPKTSWKLISYQ